MNRFKYIYVYITIMDRDSGIILQSCKYLHHTQCALHDKSSMKLYKLEENVQFFLYNLEKLYFTLENSAGPNSHNTASVNYCLTKHCPHHWTIT